MSTKTKPENDDKPMSPGGRTAAACSPLSPTSEADKMGLAEENENKYNLPLTISESDILCSVINEDHSTKSNIMKTLHQKITCEPGSQRGRSVTGLSARAAVLSVTDHEAKHLAVDIGEAAARQQQASFAGAVERLVTLLAKELPEHTFTVRFLDSRPSAKACKAGRDWWKLLAVQLTICHGAQIGYDVALRHSYGNALIAFVEQTTWPHPKCAWGEGKTVVVATKSSKMMSVHSKIVLKNPSSVCLSEITK